MNPVELIGPSIAVVVLLVAMIAGGCFAHRSPAAYLRENGSQDD